VGTLSSWGHLELLGAPWALKGFLGSWGAPWALGLLDTFKILGSGALGHLAWALRGSWGPWALGGSWALGGPLGSWEPLGLLGAPWALGVPLGSWGGPWALRRTLGTWALWHLGSLFIGPLMHVGHLVSWSLATWALRP
jgi:hypothetical protein